MCRWFVYISRTEPCLLEDVLVTSSHSLSKQVHEHYLPKLLSHNPAIHAEPTTEAEITARNRLFNVDGFGMAWYTPTRSTFSPPSSYSPLQPALYKSIQPPLHDANFRSICANTDSKVLLAHIRAATSTAITPTNNHPFAFGIHTIMHNGYIASFSRVKRRMCEAMCQEAYAHIQGGTDTEHFAALLMTMLCTMPSQAGDDQIPSGWEEYHTTEQLEEALARTITTINTIQAEVLGTDAGPNDLNIAITDGQSLVACRYRNHPAEQPPSLYYSTKAGVTLNRQYPDHPDGAEGPHKLANKSQKPQAAEGHNPYARRKSKDHGKHVIVASEPSTYRDQDWVLIEKNHIILVGPAGDIKLTKMEC